LEELTVDITKVNSLCEKIDTAVPNIDDENVKNVLIDVSAAIKLLNKNHEGIVKIHTNKVTHTASSNGMASLGNISKRNRIQSSTSVTAPVSVHVPVPVPVPTPSPAYENSSASLGTVSGYYQSDSNPELKAFKDAVTKAESSTLVFNLDLGRIPIMNTETMSTRATLALTAMAADAENRPGNIPTEETVSTIDDILSMAKNIEFFGKKTKSYINSKDSKSGSYCTIPVKYEFEDKEVRFEAEKFLRNKCGAHCATPYPIILRECIKQVTEKVKADYPDNQVKVQVDTNNFCLKVARRFVTEGVDKKSVRWESYEKVIPLPVEALDITSRKVPEGFKIKYLPPSRDKGMRGSPVRNGAASESGPEAIEVMEVTVPGSPNNADGQVAAHGGSQLESY
jgi:hypothetical protein